MRSCCDNVVDGASCSPVLPPNLYVVFPLSIPIEGFHKTMYVKAHSWCSINGESVFLTFIVAVSRINPEGTERRAVKARFSLLRDQGRVQLYSSLEGLPLPCGQRGVLRARAESRDPGRSGFRGATSHMEVAEDTHPVLHVVAELRNPNFPPILHPNKINNPFADSTMQFFQQMTLE